MKIWNHIFRLSFLNCSLYTSCRNNCENLSFIQSLTRSSNIWFHRFIFIHSSFTGRVYYEIATWLAPSWLDCSFGRALHQYRRGHGFESRSSLNVLRLSFRNWLSCRNNCEDLSFIQSFTRTLNIWFHIFIFIYSSVTGILRTRNMMSSQLAW